MPNNALPLSPEAFERIQGLRRLVYNSQDYLEGQKAFLEKRPPVFGESEGFRFQLLPGNGLILKCSDQDLS